MLDIYLVCWCRFLICRSLTEVVTQALRLPRLCLTPSTPFTKRESVNLLMLRCEWPSDNSNNSHSYVIGIDPDFIDLTLFGSASFRRPRVSGFGLYFK